jgi:hypothetical protein
MECPHATVRRFLDYLSVDNMLLAPALLQGIRFSTATIQQSKLTSALQCRRWPEHVPQWFGTNLTVGWHVV